ncbi:hypothetical protein CK203_070756 [Vitis vinifera]|uniref:Uncharacterized protein n=1 Tax=Vitis vinifera TaxID=29760 RepID=A0A438C171_VITVI|nr:hypothetical protein CK203_070756 [Vitis vinifera]
MPECRIDYPKDHSPSWPSTSPLLPFSHLVFGFSYIFAPGSHLNSISEGKTQNFQKITSTIFPRHILTLVPDSGSMAWRYPGSLFGSRWNFSSVFQVSLFSC